MADPTEVIDGATEPKKSKVKEPKPPMINYIHLFRYARGIDFLLLFGALIAALLHALVFPIAIVVYSELVAMFIDRSLGIGTSSTTHALPWFGGGAQLYVLAVFMMFLTNFEPYFPALMQLMRRICKNCARIASLLVYL